MKRLILALLLVLPLYACKTVPPTQIHGKGYCESCPRDKNGKIARSSKAKKEFMVMTGFPHGRKGYVVDHIIALKRSGCDCPSNMQWQTIEESKLKDKWE